MSQGSESNLVKTTTGIETNQKGLLTVSEDGSTTREGVFAGGDAVMGARTVVEAVAIAKQVAESMDKYMKSLPADTTPRSLRRHPHLPDPPPQTFWANRKSNNAFPARPVYPAGRFISSVSI